MKRWLLILLLCLPGIAAAQSPQIEEFFDRYTSAEGFTSMQLERKMMLMMSKQAAERGDKGLSILLGDIEFIRIIVLKEGDSAEFIRAAEAAINSDKRFRPVTSGTEAGQTTRFYHREGRLSSNSELVMISSGVKENVVVNIYGEFDLRQITRLSSIRPK